MTEEAAFRLAWFIEQTHARERVRLKNQTRDPLAVHREFDPLAATCLAELILTEARR